MMKIMSHRKRDIAVLMLLVLILGVLLGFVLTNYLRSRFAENHRMGVTKDGRLCLTYTYEGSGEYSNEFTLSDSSVLWEDERFCSPTKNGNVVYGRIYSAVSAGQADIFTECGLPARKIVYHVTVDDDLSISYTSEYIDEVILEPNYTDRR